MPIRLHLDDPDLLAQAIDFTARVNGFNRRLVEKDYFCSVVLEYLATSNANLTFKGGTCLAKVHGNFFRLSEDLDFSISTGLDATRGDRSRRAAALKTVVAAVPDALPGFQIIEPLGGANGSTQYNASLGYESLLDGQIEPVRIEVGVREPTLLPVHAGAATTALLNPISEQKLVAAYPVASLSYIEAMAEKVRAALCRNEVAIRDYFDVDHATRNAGFNPIEPGFLGLLRRRSTCHVPDRWTYPLRERICWNANLKRSCGRCFAKRGTLAVRVEFTHGQPSPQRVSGRSTDCAASA